MAKFIKKLFTIALSLALVLVLIPITSVVHAEGEDAVASVGENTYTSLAEAIENANGDEEVKLLSDVNLTETLEIGKTLTINLNSHSLTKTLSSASDKTPLIKALSGYVTIKNGNIAYDVSTYTGTGATSNANLINVGMNMSNGIYSGGDCELTLDSVNASIVFPKGKSLSMIYVESGKLNVTNSNLSATNVSGNTSAQYIIYTTAHASAVVDPYVTISNSTLDTNGSAGIHAIWLQGTRDTLHILGNDVVINADATWKPNSYTTSYAYAINNQSGATCTIEGGKFLGKVWQTKGTVDVSGGYFSYAQGTTGQKNKVTVAEGYEYVENTGDDADTYPYVVREIKAGVAQIGDVQYETLADAIAAVATDNTKTTIQMIEDEVITNETITVATGKNIVLDLNGKTVSGTSDQKSVYFISNAGTLEITDTSANKDGKITFQAVADTGYSVENVAVLNEGGTLILTEGTVENTTVGGLTYAIKNSSNAWANSVISTFNMTGGRVSAPQGDGAVRVYQNTGIGWKVESKNYVNISGGTIVDTGMFIDTFLYTVNQDATDFNNDDLTKGCVIDTVINISGGTINGLIDLKVRHPYNTEINISGGDFTNCELRTRKVNSEYGKSLKAGEISEPTEPMFNITGGKFAFISNGRIFVVNPDQNYSFTTDYKPYYVDGGVFNVDLNNYAGLSFAEGKKGVANTDTDTKDAYPYTVGNAYVAQIGDVKYESLKDAIAEAETGDVIELIADDNVSLTDGSEITINKTLTITGATNGNGEPLYTIYGKSAQAGANDIFVTGNGTVTLSNLKIKNFGNNVGTDPGHAPIYVSTNFTGTVNLENLYISDFNRGGVFLYGGNFNVDNCYIDCANSRSGAFTKGIEIKGNATGTIENTLICNMERSSTDSVAGIEIYGSGSVLVDTCTIISDVGDHSAVKATYGVVSSRVGTHDPSGGSTTIKDTSISTTNACLSVADSDEYGPVNNYSFTVIDSDFDNYIATWSATSSITINSGSFAEDVYADAGTIVIHGGDFTNFAPDTSTGTISIDGGTFDSDPTVYVVEGYKAVVEDEIYSVVPVTYVAQIGNEKYETLAAAINVANADTSSNAITIKLLADLDFSDDEYKAYKWSGSNVNPLAITRSNVTLDLNGKTISNMGNCALGVGSIYAKDGTIANVTIKNGTLLAGKTDNVTNSYVLLIGGTNNCLIDSVTTLGGVNNCNNSNVVIKDSTIRGTKYYTVCAQTGANVTIRGTSYTKNTDQTVQTKAMFWVQGAGTDEDLITSSNLTGAFNASIITIESGYFNVDSNGAFYLGGGLAPTLTGGYYNIDPAAYVADGYAVESVSEEYEGVTYTYHVTTKKVAQIGNVQYETLAAAINAANQAENGVKTTIVLINDEAFDYTTGGMTINAGKVVEIDLNGHQVVGTANSGTTSAFINNYGSLTILDSTDVDEDGADCGRLAAGANPSWVWDGSDSYSGSYASNLINNLGTVVVKSGLLQNLSSGSAAYVVDNNSTSYDVSLTVTGGKLLATKSSVRQFANSKTHTNALTVTGGTIQGGRFGVVVHEYGQLAMNLSGGTITTTDTDNYAVNVWTTSTMDTQYANINVSGDVVIDGYLYLTDLGRKSSTGTPATVSISGGYIEGLIFYGNTDGLEGSVTGGHYVLNSVTDEQVAYLLSEQCIADGYEVAENQGADAEEYPYIVQEAVTYVAQIGNEKYETLNAAVAAAKAGDTIVLINDLTTSTYPYVDKNITLDLNGYTAELGGQYGLIVSGSNLVVTDNSTNGDGKIVSTARYGVFVQVGGTLTVNGGTIETVYGNNGYAIYVHGGSANKDRVVVNAGNIVAGSGAYCIFGYNASEVEINGGAVTSASYGIAMFKTSKLTVNGGTITGNTYPIATNGNSGQNAQIIITGGTIGNENNGSGIYLPSGSLDVSGGTITGKTGIYFKSTNLNITGGEIVGVGPAAEYNYNGNGSNSTGDALVIDSCGYPNGIDNVNVSGGHFVSANAAAVKVYTYQENEPVEKFITGGIYNTLPEEEYVADGYKAVYYEGNYQVGPVSYEATTEGSIEDTTVPETITYNVNKVVKEDETSSAETMASETSLSVVVSANAVENDTKAVASLGNIKDDATLKAIVEKAVEAASSAIDANTNSATIEITVAKGDADVVNNKVTYEVHPEALIKVDGEEVASVKIENEDLNGTFTFKLYAGNITQSGKYVKVTHIHSDNTSEDLGELLVDAEGYVTVTGVESFSDFTLEVVETEVSAYAKFGYTISLEESINIIFNVKDLTDDLNTYTVEYIDPSTGEIVEKVPTNATLNSYVIAKCAAKQMGDVFTVVVKHNGTKINQTTDFSIKNYCETVIEGNFSNYLKDLCRATLDYGRYAQETFNYKVGSLVNGGYDGFVNESIVVPGYTGSVESTFGSNKIGGSFSLTTESQTIFNVYFKGSNVIDYKVYVDNQEVSPIELSSDKIQVSISGIAAKELDKKITFKIVDPNSSCELTYVVSPVDYMGFAVEHGSQINLNRALYNYHLKAVDYFDHK